VRTAARLLNVAIAVATLASGVAVLVSDLTVPGYREHYRDALWLVAAYCVVQVVMAVEFARDSPRVPWLAVAKAAAAYALLVGFIAVWPAYRWWTPGRYVYQVFDWGEATRIGLFAFVFLGRGAFNTVNAFYFTAPWWRPLRLRRPLLGRLVTAVPIGLTVLWVWVFAQLVREEARTFSPDAFIVAREVLETLPCETIRARAGTKTTDIRARGERRYEVRIAYDCPLVQVMVRAEDGRLGTASAPRPECCARGQ
jgi:hypothetical protein